MKRNHFTGTKPTNADVSGSVEKEVSEDSFAIPVGKIVFGIVAGSIVVAAMTIVGMTTYKEYQSWNSAWSQVKFAKNNPQVVKVVQDQYESKLKGVQDEFLNPTSSTVSAQVMLPKE